MRQGKRLPTVLVAGNLCHDLRGDVACREEAVRLLDHGLTDHCSVLQHILKVDEVTVVLLLSVVVRIMEMYDSGLMCLNYILRQKHSLGQIFGYLTGHVVTLCRVDHRILVGVFLIDFLVHMVYERKDSVVRGVGLTCELSLVTVTHIFLCNLISSHLHDTGLDHILNVLHVNCVGH